MRPLLRAVLAGAAAIVLIGGCGGSDQTTTSASSSLRSGEAAPRGGGAKLERIGDFDQPVYVTQPPASGDLYVVEKAGTVRIVRDGSVVGTPALDIADKVSTTDEQGLLSIAFPPDFQRSHVVYAYYTGSDQDQHVVRFTVRPDGSFDPASEREILRMDDFAPNHNGGLLLFGPDGHLYIGTGDGGLENDPHRNGQNLGSLLGKLLRIDPAESRGGAPYAIPADNPFRDRPGARPEIYSYGLRNSWRFSFDSKTDALAIGDVGQDTLEEIDYAPKGTARGANFGWSAYEGTNRFNHDQSAPNAVAPIFTYSHDSGGCSITGGYVVRDRALPGLYGRYLYGDLCEGELRSLVPTLPRARADRTLGLRVDNLDSFGVDDAGHVYVISLDGPVYRLVPG